MMRIRGVWTTNAVALLLGFGMYSSFIVLPQYVETPTDAGYGFGSSVTQAGLFLVPSTLMMLIVGSQTGRFERRFGSKPPLLAGGAFAMASFLILAFARSERWEIYLAAALLGAGIGLAFAAMANLIIENVGPEQTGVATGMNTVTRTVGGAFGGAVTASILAGTVTSNGYPTPHGFTLAFAALRGGARGRHPRRPRHPATAARAGVRAAPGGRPRGRGPARRDLGFGAAGELDHALEPRLVSHDLADHDDGWSPEALRVGRDRPERADPALRARK